MSELYIYQNARCNDKKKISYFSLQYSSFFNFEPSSCIHTSVRNITSIYACQLSSLFLHAFFSYSSDEKYRA